MTDDNISESHLNTLNFYILISKLNISYFVIFSGSILNIVIFFINHIQKRFFIDILSIYSELI